MRARRARRRRAPARRAIRPTIPPVLQERDALIDKIVRGEDVDASVRRFAALVKERDRLVATSRAAKEAEEKARLAEHEFKEAYRKSVDSRGRLALHARRPIRRTRCRRHEARFRGDWGRVVKKEAVRLTPKNALDEGEPATLYEVAGQARHYFIYGETLRRRAQSAVRRRRR